MSDANAAVVFRVVFWYVVAVWLLVAVLGWDIGRIRGYPWRGLAMGLIFNLIGVLIIAVIPSTPAAEAAYRKAVADALGETSGDDAGRIVTALRDTQKETHDLTLQATRAIAKKLDAVIKALDVQQ